MEKSKSRALSPKAQVVIHKVRRLANLSLALGASLTRTYPHLYRYLLASPALMNEKTTPTTTMKEIITITKLRVPLSPPDVVAIFLPIYPIQIYLLESSKGKYPMPAILYL